MKSFKALLITIVAVGLTLVACSKKSSVDTSALESSFKSAEPAAQSAADNAVSSIKSGDYANALSSLQGLAKDAKLTSEQQQAIKDVLAQVQQAISDADAKAAAEAGKTAGDAQKSVPSLPK